MRRTLLAEPDEVCLLLAEIGDLKLHDDSEAAADPASAAGMNEIELAAGRRLRISGTHDPEALVRLIRGLSLIPIPANSAFG